MDEGKRSKAIRDFADFLYALPDKKRHANYAGMENSPAREGALAGLKAEIRREVEKFANAIS